MSTELEKKEKRIRALLAGMAKLGAMRPGTLTVQYRNPAEKKTPFNQLSYTHRGRIRSEYVRPENLAAVRREVETYKKFKLLVEEVTEQSLEASRLRHKRDLPTPRRPQRADAWKRVNATGMRPLANAFPVDERMRIMAACGHVC